MAISHSEPHTESSLDELTVEQAHDFFNRQARLLLGISREEFLARMDDGQLDYDNPRTDHLIVLLPFAR
jgi:hypothetical protein